MNTRAYAIEIFVAEGIPGGLRIVKKGNWDGVCLICPRASYKGAREREELLRSGVYLLVGNQDGLPEPHDGRPGLYVGEADCVRRRLDEHHAQKDFWQQAIIFTTEAGDLHKGIIKHLEAQLLELAEQAGQCRIVNRQLKPQRPRLSEAEKANFDGYLQESRDLLLILGVDFFKKLQGRGVAEEGAQIYFCKGDGWNATGHETEEGFVVRAGSIARKGTVPSMETNLASSYRKRRELIAKGALRLTDDGYVFTADTPFSSPSQASDVCSGRSSNGLLDWKDRRGTSLKENRASSIRAPVEPPPRHAQGEVGEPMGDPIIYCFRSRDGGWDAQGREAGGNRFTVLRGGFARRETVRTMGQGPRQVREQLINDGVLVEVSGRYRFETDHTFSSPSSAADVCSGSSRNGLDDWKDAQGVSLKEHRQRRER